MVLSSFMQKYGKLPYKSRQNFRRFRLIGLFRYIQPTVWQVGTTESSTCVACNKKRRKLVACNGEADMAHVNSRVQKHRDALRMAGLRPVQIWVPDTRRPDFAEECRRQCRLAAQADMADTDMQRFMDEALADMDGWTE
ncbi:UNVERIFIED_ORG: hypothetical protein ABIB63_004588 [Xanthomonas axonopodis]